MTQRGFNPGINVPKPGEAHPSVITALQQLIWRLGKLSSPTFKTVALSDLADDGAGFVKNNATGKMSGGNTIDVGDLPAHASTHAATGSDKVNHDLLLGFVASEHIDHTAVSVSAGTGLTGGGDISVSRTLSLDATLKSNYDAAYAHSLLTSGNPHSVTPGELNLVIGTDVQAWDDDLDDIAALTPTNGSFIVGDGTNWVTESGNTARTFLGLGTGDTPTFASVTAETLYVTRNMYLISDVSNILFSGGDTTNSGGNIACFGGTHATLANVIRFRQGSTIVAYCKNGGNWGFGTTDPQEDVHAADTVRADVAFNLNGTDGWSGSFTNGDGATVTVSGGIITSVV